MLERALVLIDRGVGSLDELALQLGVSPELARELLLQLVRLGYLRPARAMQCASGCQGCPMAGSCHSLPFMWALTEKGQRAAQASL